MPDLLWAGECLGTVTLDGKDVSTECRCIETICERPTRVLLYQRSPDGHVAFDAEGPISRWFKGEIAFQVVFEIGRGI